ncbi:MAG: TCP-1/cpn60 chaperonin family protein, partial [Candidatus Bathyarchaeota archaeon]
MSAPGYGGQPIIILKEGTQRNRGKDAREANIMAARVVAEAVKSSLGPKGMDKMLVDSFGDVTITNDGATMLKEMDVQHPAAKMIVEVSKTQDDEVGDGTTSVVVLTGELLGKAVELMKKQIHPTVVIDGYREAQKKAVEFLEGFALEVDPFDRKMLKKVAKTAMASKLIAGQRDYIADVAVDAVLQVVEEADGGNEVDIDMIKVEKKPGGSITDTALINGLIIDKEVVHADMPKLVR